MTKQIELTQGLVALVDNEDYDKLSKYKWHAHINRNTFYVCRTAYNGKQVTVMMHREILGLSHGDKRQVDHRNQNGLDNRRTNLRIANHKINGYNHRKRADNSSGHNGVHWRIRENKWAAQIGANGKRIHLGVYANLCDAVEARRQAEIEYWGEASL